MHEVYNEVLFTPKRIGQRALLVLHISVISENGVGGDFDVLV